MLTNVKYQWRIRFVLPPSLFSPAYYSCQNKPSKFLYTNLTNQPTEKKISVCLSAHDKQEKSAYRVIIQYPIRISNHITTCNSNNIFFSCKCVFKLLNVFKLLLQAEKQLVKKPHNAFNFKITRKK